jgi:hypothetical protein
MVINNFGCIECRKNFFRAGKIRFADPEFYSSNKIGVKGIQCYDVFIENVRRNAFVFEPGFQDMGIDRSIEGFERYHVFFLFTTITFRRYFSGAQFRSQFNGIGYHGQMMCECRIRLLFLFFRLFRNSFLINAETSKLGMAMVGMLYPISVPIT